MNRSNEWKTCGKIKNQQFKSIRHACYSTFIGNALLVTSVRLSVRNITQKLLNESKYLYACTLQFGV